MPPALKALLSQLGGWAAALLLVKSGLVPASVWPAVATQALAAAALSQLLRSAPWWIAIHLAFSPLLITANTAGVPPLWYLAAFIVLTVVYWTSFRTQVPLYLSNPATAQAVLELLPGEHPARLLDLGSGTGTLLIPLARTRPDCGFTGIEAAPGPYLVSRLLARSLRNIAWVRGDFFRHTWAGHDVVYAFLSPVPMRAVWKKAQRELADGALLVSNSFPVPDVRADAEIEVGDARGTRLYVYRIDRAKRPN